jgi:Cupin
MRTWRLRPSPNNVDEPTTRPLSLSPYIIKGVGRATVFNTGPAAMTANFHAGDIGYVKKALGHFLENTGNTDLVYMGVFRAERFEEVSLSDWLVAQSNRHGCRDAKPRSVRHGTASEELAGRLPSIESRIAYRLGRLACGRPFVDDDYDRAAIDAPVA